MNESTPDINSARAKDFIKAFLSGRTEKTARDYAQTLEDFRAFQGARSTVSAVRSYLNRSPGDANAVVLAYRTYLVERGLAPSTINRRLSALRSMAKLARMLGFVCWTIEIPNLRVTPYRDTRGPTREEFERALAALQDRRDAKGARDLALIRLLHDLALRCGEVLSLDLCHLDLDAGTLSILGKCRTARELLTVLRNLPIYPKRDSGVRFLLR